MRPVHCCPVLAGLLDWEVRQLVLVLLLPVLLLPVLLLLLLLLLLFLLLLQLVLRMEGVLWLGGYNGGLRHAYG